jgi:hypothetical protein
VTLAAGALVNDLGDGGLAVGPDLNALAAVPAGVVLSGIDGDDEVGRLIGPAASAEADVVVRHPGVVEAFEQSDDRGSGSVLGSGKGLLDIDGGATLDLVLLRARLLLCENADPRLEGLRSVADERPGGGELAACEIREGLEEGLRDNEAAGLAVGAGAADDGELLMFGRADLDEGATGGAVGEVALMKESDLSMEVSKEEA